MGGIGCDQRRRRLTAHPGRQFVWVLDDESSAKRRPIQEAAEGPGPFLSNQLDYVHIRFFGPVAVAQEVSTDEKQG